MAEQNWRDILVSNSVLGLIYSPKEIQSLLDRYPPVEFTAGTLIVTEGDAAETLHIPLDHPYSVCHGRDHSILKQGDLAAGRAFNLYSLMRRLPFQFSLVADQTSFIFSIPWSVVESEIEMQPILKKYLLRISEPSELRYLAKDVENAGCSSRFKVHFLGRLEEKTLPPQTWIQKQGQTCRELLIVIGGDVQAFKKTQGRSLQAQWLIPQKVWYGWKECVAVGRAPYSLRSQSEVKLLSLTDRELFQLRSEFPEDFAMLHEWMGHTRAASDRNSTEPEVYVDLEEVLANSPRQQWPWWKQFPWVQQNDEMDCGAACLSMISEYYGKTLPVQYWRSQLSTNHDGTSLFDLGLIAEKNGFTSLPLGFDSVQEIDTSALPVIALRKYHYMVIFKIKKDFVVVGDPALGIRRISHAVFNEGMEPAILVLRPGSDFFQNQAPPSPYTHFLRLAFEFKRELFLALATSFLMVASSLVPPVLTQFLMDDVLSARDYELFKVVGWSLMAYVIFNSVLTRARAYYTQFIAIKFDFLAKSALLQKMLSLPFGFFGSRHVGDFTRRMQEFEKFRIFLTSTAQQVVMGLVSIFVYLGFLFAYNWKVALVVLVLAPPFMIISMLFSRQMTLLYSEYFSSQAEQDSYLYDIIDGAQSIKSVGGELASRRRFEEKMAKALQARYGFEMSSVALGGYVEGYFQAARYAVLCTTVYLALAQELSPGQVVAISLLVTEVLSPFQRIAYQWADFQEIKSVLTRLNDIFLATSEKRQVGSVAKENLRGEIEFRDVWFRYGGEGSEWVLKGVSFKIQPGSRVAVVGPSGCGKSTLSYLLNRTYDAQKGQVMIDGKDVRDYDIDWLRQQVGVLSQSAHLFLGSIRDNIAYSTPYSTEDQLKEAALTADALGFIENRPYKFDSYVPGRGFGFSGGEKQKLSIARTLFRQPRILVLDEATSAMDGISEKNFMSRLNSWGEDKKTILSIAHRLSTVLYSQVIIVMNDGKIVDIGEYDYLSETSKLFIAMFGSSRGPSVTKHREVA